jgi:NADH-quinone oxidoreductase subunit L
LKALLVNRFADMFFLLGVVAIYSVFNTLEFDAIFGTAPFLTHLTINLFGYNVGALNFITLVLFIGACAKSAQLGLHT